MFDLYVARERRVGWRQGALVIASAAFHALLIGGALILPGFLGEVELVEPPALQVTFVAAPAISLPPAPGTAVQGERIAPTRARPPVQLRRIAPVSRPQSTQRTVAKEFATQKPEEPDDSKVQPGADTHEDVPPGGQIGSGGTIDGAVLDAQRLLYPDPHLPEDFKREHPREVVAAVYRLCIGTNGKLTTVVPIQPIGDVDQLIMDHLRTTWLYRPQRSPICVSRRFIFMID